MDRKHDTEVRLSVIAVTWNAKKYVDQCLSSLDQIDEAATEVIVVDNASTDGTPELIAEKFKSLRLIRNSENLGFSRANNIGIEQARGRYVCLVNSDVIVPPGCLCSLTQYLEMHPDVGVVGPQMLGPAGNVRRSAMRFPSLLSSLARAFGLDGISLISRLVHAQMMTDFKHDRLADVDILNGWFWVIRREALERVGLLDERFFIYGEDMDWCRRFRSAGWRIVFVPEANAIHFGGASSSAAPVRFYIEQQKADFQYWEKHHAQAAAAAYKAIILFHNVLRTVGYAVVYCVYAKKRGDSAHKVRRSLGVLRWMLSGRQ